MVVIFVILLGVFIYGIKLPEDKKSFHTDYMSVEKTTAVKGIFIILVFLCHFKSYADFTAQSDILFYDYFSRINQRVVTMFMFYSGYGIMLSAEKKGRNYINSIPKNRILRVLIEFDIAVTVYTLLKLIAGSKFADGSVFSIKQYLLSLVGWESVGNSNWYIFAVLVLYVFTYISFKAFGNNRYLSVSGVTLLTVIFAVVMLLSKIKEPYWYNTMICYSAGMWFALFKDKVEKIMFKNNIVYFAVFIIFAAFNIVFSKLQPYSFLFYEMNILSFTAFSVILTMKFSFNNKVLRYCGKNLFGLYVYQRIPMIYLKMLGLADFNIYIYFVLCAVCTVVLAELFGKLNGIIFAKLFNGKLKGSKK